MLNSSGDWTVAVYHDLEALVKAWEQRLDQSATAVIHIGFERVPARYYDDVISCFQAQVLLTEGAKYALPGGFHSTDTPVAKSKGGALFLATQGWGYLSTSHQRLVQELLPIKRNFGDWVSGFVTRHSKHEGTLIETGIFDEATYLEHEAKLQQTLRMEIGIYRFWLLCRNREDPCEISAAAPPWLRQRLFKSMDITVRLANVFTHVGINLVADLDRFETAQLLKVQNCGRKSINDLINTLKSALEIGPINQNFVAESVQAVGLIDAVRRSLSDCEERERDIISRRMGLDGPAETLEEIGSRHGVTRERIRQIEAKTIRKLLAKEFWDDLLGQKLRTILANREYPLPLRGVEAIDLWFVGVGESSEVVRYLLSMVPDTHTSIVEIDGIEYLALLTQERWQSCLGQARNLLSGGVDKGWPEIKCRQLVEALLPLGCKEFREILWVKATRLCHFVTDSSGQRYLRQYGRGADQTVEAILEESSHPLHFTEIAARASDRAGRQIDVRRAHNAAANVGFLFARGTYGLLKHIAISTALLEQIAEQAEDLVADAAADRQWHSAELAAMVSERIGDAPPFDKYVLDIALQRSGNLDRLGRMVWRQPGIGNEGARIEVTQAIITIVQQAGRPLRASDIQQRLIAARGLNQQVQIHQADPLIRVGAAIWGLNDRDVEIKRKDQHNFNEGIARLLEDRGTGIHISEIRDLIEIPGAMQVEAAFSLCVLDDRLRVNAGQYLFLRKWGESRRKTIQEAVRSVLAGMTGSSDFETIVGRVQAEVGRPCERSAISSSLQSLGAKFDEHAMWRLEDNSREDDEGDTDLPFASGDDRLAG